ncbi:MAG: 4Fe-4S binding protein [Paracoccaceae bacterium]
MFHPGLPFFWGLSVWAVMALSLVGVLVARAGGASRTRHVNLSSLPLIGAAVRRAAASAGLLRTLKLLFLGLFLMIVAAGLFGTPLPERNAATVLTWNLWWAGLVFSVFFLGSAWCAVCPWDTLATLLVRRRLTARSSSHGSLDLRVPKFLRNIWPALAMFVGLSWLELGAGVTVSPYATALLALAILVLATTSAALFERKAFCRFFCPVGRTVGFYSQLAPVELRPQDADICANCTSLECYHGSETVEPCPTHQVMGRMTQNTFCTSCGNCTRSCPHGNVAWRLRSPSAEAVQDARPHWDEACFMVGLLALTSFHGLSMMPFWEDWTIALGRAIGDSGSYLPSFTILFAAGLALPVSFYTAAVWLTRRLAGPKRKFTRDFSRFAFVALPLAFAYHLSHNLNHLAREGAGFGEVLANPLGLGAVSLNDLEKHLRAMNLLIPQNAIWAIQSGLMALGFLIALRVILHRGSDLTQPAENRIKWALSPMILFAAGITGLHLWILMQPMVMRF